jgi:hypothetical protein
MVECLQDRLLADAGLPLQQDDVLNHRVNPLLDRRSGRP